MTEDLPVPRERMRLMNDLVLSSATFGVVISFAAYGAGLWLKNRYKKAFFNPLLISIILVAAFLLIFRIDYESYNASAKYLSYLLTPATVSLAVPLYAQIETLRKNIKAIVISLAAGAVTSMASIFAMAMIFGLTHEQYVTMLPKSVTLAIGTGIVRELGGYPAITAAVTILTGILGNVCAEGFARLLRIHDKVARGLAIGACSHAIGTARALELGEVEGAMSSLAIVVSGLITVIFAAFFAMLW